MSLLLDVPGLKAQLNKAKNVDDDELSLYVDAAVGMVEAMIGPVDLRPNQTRTLLAAGSGAMSQGPWLVDLFPIASVDLLSCAGTAVDPSVLTVEGRSGILTSSRPLSGPVRVTFTAGRATGTYTVPGAMKLAARVIGAHLWKTQRGESQQPSGEDGDGMVVGAGYAVPYMAADLLRQFMLPPAVA